jgi:hypothetical protein
MSFARARFEPVEFACCINSCICYTGPYADLEEWPDVRNVASGRAGQTFPYMPYIPRLGALMANHTYATHLQYCAEEHTKTYISAFFFNIDVIY